MKDQAILCGLIYKFKRGCADAHAQRGFACLSPASDWPPTMTVGDAWICDEHGNIDPGVNASPVPVRRDAIGKLIGRMTP